MNLYFTGTILSVATLYMISAAGISVCMKSGKINLGNEGQIYTGGFICAVVLIFFSKFNTPPFVAIIAAFFCSILASIFLTFLSAFLEKYRNINFLLTSFIVSSAIIPLLDGLVSGPFRSNTGNLLSTEYISENYRFTLVLPPSSLNLSLFGAVLICILCHYFLFKTETGKEICTYGIAPEFSLYSGLSETKILFSAAAISGALNGITGAVAVCGIYFSCQIGFYAGIGWNALAVAMLAKQKPILVIPASLFMAILITEAEQFALFHNLDFDISGIIQAAVIIIISFPLFKNNAEHKNNSTTKINVTLTNDFTTETNETLKNDFTTKINITHKNNSLLKRILSRRSKKQ